MAQRVYWVQGLTDADSLTRIQQQLCSQPDIRSAVWIADAVLVINATGRSLSAHIQALCRRESPQASVIRVAAFMRCLPLYMWAGSVLLWLAGQFLPVPFWTSMLCWAFSAVMGMAPLVLGGLSLWKKRPWAKPIWPVAWVTLAFLCGHAAAGALTALLYSMGLSLLRARLQQLNQTTLFRTDEDTGGIQRRAFRAVHIHTMVVFLLAVMVGALVPILTDMTVSDGLYRALVLLVLAATGIWPMAVALHLRAGRQVIAKQGVTLKSARYIETLANTDAIALDRQGSLIAEPLFVTSLHTLPDVSADMCVGLAALLESSVDHPVARAIVQHAARVDVTHIEQAEINDMERFPSMGVVARMEDHRLLCGNHHLLERYDLVAEHLPEGTVYLAIDDRVIAVFDVTGPIRPDATQAMDALHQQGVARIVLLTGEQPTAAEKTAVQVGIEEVYAGLLPESKLSVFRKIQKKHTATAFIGGGIQDIPTMKQADVGVALSSAPPEVQHAADILLTTDKLMALPQAMTCCRHIMRRIRQKGWVGVVVCGAAIISGIIGVLPMWGVALVETALAVGATMGLTPHGKS